MSVMIESTEELLALLKKMDLKVTNVEELHHLLATINADYNPDAAQQKTARQIGTVVPGAMAAAAAAASFFLLAANAPPSTTQAVGGLAVIWGPVALVSIASVIAAAVLTHLRRGETTQPHLADRPAPRREQVGTHIVKELPI